MQESLDASLVRIRSADGRVHGAGFLVGQRQILTCAHVVSQTLDLAHTLVDLPQGVVSLDFPLLPQTKAKDRPPRQSSSKNSNTSPPNFPRRITQAQRA